MGFNCRLKIYLFCSMYITFSSYVCLCTMYTPGAHGGQKRASDLPGQGLQVVVSHHLCARNQTQELCGHQGPT